MGKKKKHCQSVEKIVSQAIWQLCRCCDNASSGPRLATGIAVLNRFNGTNDPPPTCCLVLSINSVSCSHL